jgi:hypothetical protein
VFHRRGRSLMGSWPRPSSFSRPLFMPPALPARGSGSFALPDTHISLAFHALGHFRCKALPLLQRRVWHCAAAPKARQEARLCWLPRPEGTALAGYAAARLLRLSLPAAGWHARPCCSAACSRVAGRRRVLLLHVLVLCRGGSWGGGGGSANVALGQSSGVLGRAGQGSNCGLRVCSPPNMKSGRETRGHQPLYCGAEGSRPDP